MGPNELRLLQELGKGLPPVSEPFLAIGEEIGMTGDEVLRSVRHLRDSGIIRKFRARINQRRLSIKANALVAWQVPGTDIERVGALLASFSEVSHCIERTPVPGRWEYSLYTVHHGRNRGDVLTEIQTIAGKAGGWSYTVMFSTDEFKRVPLVPPDKREDLP